MCLIFYPDVCVIEFVITIRQSVDLVASCFCIQQKFKEFLKVLYDLNEMYNRLFSHLSDTVDPL